MEYFLVIAGGIWAYCMVMFLLEKKASERQLVEDRLKALESISVQRTVNDDLADIPFVDRVIKPILQKLIKKVSTVVPVNEEQREQMQAKLLKAGIKMKYKDYMSLNVIVVFGCLVLGFLYGLTEEDILSSIMDTMVGFIVGYLIMNLYLTSSIRKRSEEMDKQFPDFLDLMCVCIEAGLGFDQGVGYVCSKYPGTLSDEFRIYLKEISLGSTRKQALNNMQNRCELEPLKTFSAAVLQADEMGISLKTILNAQSESVRERRKQIVEEEAQKLPIKILFPIIIFIFPIIFVVLMMPAASSMMANFGGM